MFTPNDEIATLVVCEDDHETRELLADNLTADRFTVLQAPTASDALMLSQFNQPDLILLDLDLPDGSGLDVLRAIRSSDGVVGRHNPSVPIILISGYGAEQDRIRCLNEGADDFIVKPYAYQELLARTKSVLRRGRRSEGGILRAAGIVVDRSRRLVSVCGRPVELSRKEYLMLCLMATEPLRTFTKSELLMTVWGYDSLDHSRTLDAHASRLRRKLDPVNLAYVINVWGVGYKLVEE